MVYYIGDTRQTKWEHENVTPDKPLFEHIEILTALVIHSKHTCPYSKVYIGK